MSRNDYDDMGPSFSRRSKGDNRKTYLISFMGVLIVLILILLYIVFRPVDGKEDAVQSGSSSSMELSIPSVESIPVERSTSFSAGEKKVSDKPFFSYYTVKRGDSLFSIAKAFGISEATISILNDIDDSTALTEGLMLSIPQMDGLKYTVKEGDTLSLVLSEYPVSVDEEYVREINSISGELREGAEIFIPMSLSDDDISFISPSDGVISHSFNEDFNGVPLKGVAFSQEAGSAVRAVADGVVTDAGNDSEFGRYVSLMHENGLRSSYYCLEVVNVKIGQRVSCGEVVGTVGFSNRTFGTPTLYFTIEQGSLIQDPLTFF